MAEAPGRVGTTAHPFPGAGWLSIDSPCIPIVFISAHEDAQTCGCAPAAGAVAFLQKPFDDQTLLEAVARAAEQRPSE